MRDGVITNPPGDRGVIIVKIKPLLLSTLIDACREPGMRKASFLNQGVKQDVRLIYPHAPLHPATAYLADAGLHHDAPHSHPV
jgi:hypothetical protein